MAFVADASMAAAWVLPDEQSAEAEQLIDEVDDIHVFWFEMRNLLVMAERRGRTGRKRPRARSPRFRLRHSSSDGISRAFDFCLDALPHAIGTQPHTAPRRPYIAW